MANKIAARLTAAAVAAAMGISAVPMIANAEDEIKYEYGVFLSANGEESLKKFESYRIIVLDAQFYTDQEIKRLKDNGHTVYSYINLGSIEDNRPYYNEYKALTFAPYEDWPHERWVDVSTDKWYDFQTDLAQELLDKGIDGFFVDNTDVYYVSKEVRDSIDVDTEIKPEKIFGGVERILKGYKSLKTKTGNSPYVLINGGDTFVFDYIDGVDPEDTDDNDEPFGFALEGHDTLDGIIDGINQEAVFGEIDFDADPDELRVFRAQTSGDSKYYKEYCEKVDSVGKDVYMLEYTDDESIMKKAADYAAKHDFTYFATDRGLLTIDATEAGSMPVRKDKLNGNNNSTSESKSESKSDSKADSKSSSKTDSKSESKSESKSDSKPESKTESKSESKTESKADSKIDSKTDSKSESKADSKSDSKADSKTESKSDSKTGSKSESKTESKADSRIGSKPDDTSSKADGKINVSVMKGDADLNGSINVSDIAVVASHIKGIKALSEAQFAAADVNNDGQMTVSDIAIIAAHIKGIKAIV